MDEQSIDLGTAIYEADPQQNYPRKAVLTPCGKWLVLWLDKMDQWRAAGEWPSDTPGVVLGYRRSGVFPDDLEVFERAKLLGLEVYNPH